MPVPLSAWESLLWRKPEPVVDGGGDSSVTRVSWWMGSLEMVYCLGRKVWLESK